MNFFKTKTSWSNAELIIFKLCIASAAILVGARFHHFFRCCYIPIIILFGITLISGRFTFGLKKWKKQQLNNTKHYLHIVLISFLTEVLSLFRRIKEVFLSPFQHFNTTFLQKMR